MRSENIQENVKEQKDCCRGCIVLGKDLAVLSNQTRCDSKATDTSCIATDCIGNARLADVP